MLLGRSDRGLLARWWFTVDRGLMFAVLLLMASGVGPAAELQRHGRMRDVSRAKC